MTTAMQVLEAIGIGVEGISDENAEEINELLVPKRVKREKMNFGARFRARAQGPPGLGPLAMIRASNFMNRYVQSHRSVL